MGHSCGFLYYMECVSAHRAVNNCHQHEKNLNKPYNASPRKISEGKIARFSRQATLNPGPAKRPWLINRWLSELNIFSNKYKKG